MIPSTSGTIYEIFSQAAIRLIGQFGAPCSIIRTTGAAYDPITGTPAVAPGITYPAQAFAAQWSVSRQPTMAAASGSQRFLFPAQGMAIAPDGLTDTLIWMGTRLRFVSGVTIAPAGAPVLYDMECVGNAADPNAPTEIAPFQMRTVDRMADIPVGRDGFNPRPRGS